MLDWIELHEDKLKVASLLVASLILIVSVYRWILLKWRSDVSLRKYAFLHSLPSPHVKSRFDVEVDVPESQFIRIYLVDEKGAEFEVYAQETQPGEIKISVSMEERSAGQYELTMQSPDQISVKKVLWSGNGVEHP